MRVFIRVGFCIGLDRTISRYVGEPPSLEVLVGDICDWDPTGLSDGCPKEIVINFSWGPVESPQFRRRCDAAREGLFDFDVLYALVILIVVYMKSDGCHADGFPRCPTDALKGQDFIGVIAKLVVLKTG